MSEATTSSAADPPPAGAPPADPLDNKTGASDKTRAGVPVRRVLWAVVPVGAVVVMVLLWPVSPVLAAAAGAGTAAPAAVVAARKVKRTRRAGVGTKSGSVAGARRASRRVARALTGGGRSRTTAGSRSGGLGGGRSGRGRGGSSSGRGSRRTRSAGAGTGSGSTAGGGGKRKGLAGLFGGRSKSPGGKTGATSTGSSKAGGKTGRSKAPGKTAGKTAGSGATSGGRSRGIGNLFGGSSKRRAAGSGSGSGARGGGNRSTGGRGRSRNNGGNKDRRRTRTRTRTRSRSDSGSQGRRRTRFRRIRRAFRAAYRITPKGPGWGQGVEYKPGRDVPRDWVFRIRRRRRNPDDYELFEDEDPDAGFGYQSSYRWWRGDRDGFAADPRAETGPTAGTHVPPPYCPPPFYATTERADPVGTPPETRTAPSRRELPPGGENMTGKETVVADDDARHTYPLVAAAALNRVADGHEHAAKNADRQADSLAAQARQVAAAPEPEVRAGASSLFDAAARARTAAEANRQAAGGYRYVSDGIAHQAAAASADVSK